MVSNDYCLICPECGYRTTSSWAEDCWACDVQLVRSKPSVNSTGGGFLNPETLMVEFQVDENVKTGPIGEGVQDDVVAENTTITIDQTVQEVETPKIESGLLEKVSSTEHTYEFDSIMDRWIPSITMEVNANQPKGYLLQQLDIPSSLTRTDKCAPNLLPFEQFVYGKLNLQLLFKVNAHKFQTGKVVISIIPDNPNLYGQDEAYFSVEAALMREHVILDICANNNEIIDLSWIFHRTFIRVVDNGHQNMGISGGTFARVVVQILSPINVASGNPDTCDLMMFFKISEAKFTAMSYRVALPQILEEVVEAAGGFGRYLNDVEQIYKRSPLLRNLDKPTNIVNRTEVAPHPRMNFTGAKGVTDATVMRMNPATLTTVLPEHVAIQDYSDVRQICQIWGLLDEFKWDTEQKPGVELWKMAINPSNFILEHTERVFTPIENICGMYMFWRGTMELRLDFVSTAFHTGTVMVSMIFGRTLTTMDLCAAASTYTKTFELGEQKSVVIRIPYIYDNPWRRNTNIPILPYFNIGTERNKSHTGLIYKINSYVRVYVVNRLRVVASVTPTIKVLAFVRACEDFDCTGIIAQNLYYKKMLPKETIVDSFPYDGYSAAVSSGMKTKRSLMEADGRSYKSPKDVSVKLSSTASSENKEYYKERLKRATAQVDDHMADEPTHRFKIGPRVQNLMTHDRQTNIGDLMRRPVNIITALNVPASLENDGGKVSLNACYIPCMPPQLGLISTVLSDCYHEAIRHSSHVTLTTGHRFWRGSMRFTFVFYDSSSEPIYIHYLPHSGVRIIGNKVFPMESEGDYTIYGQYTIGQQALMTEMVVPSINPTVQIEVPYMVETNWSLLHQGNESLNQNIPWRDRGDENSGHLVVQCHKDVKMDVWWSAGDDFMLGGFIGFVKAKDRTTPNVCTDSNPVTFQIGDDTTVHEVKEIVKTTMRRTMKPLMVGGAYMINPIFGAVVGALAFSDTLGKLEETIDIAHNVSQDTREPLLKVVQNVESISSTIRQPLDGTKMACGGIASWLSEILGGIFNGISYIGEASKNVINSVISMFYTTLEHFTITGFCSMIINSLYALGVFTYGTLGKVSGLLSDCAQHVLSVSSQVGGESFCALAAAILGIVGTTVGVSTEGFSLKRLLRGLFVSVSRPTTWSMVANITRFLKDIYELIYRCFMWCLGREDPNLKALDLLSRKSEYLATFIKDANQHVLEANVDHVLRHPIKKAQFWMTVCKAHQILSTIMSNPEAKVSPALGILCRDVIEKANERHMQFAAAPVRYEPFVICIEGAKNIGKSHMCTTLVVELLKNLGVTSFGTDAIFVKNPGPQYWNGYRNQPVIVFDDWLNLRSGDMMDAQISELFNLKSTAVFNPNMAKLEEKEMSANPLIVILLCNNAFPILDNVRCPEAVYRRRDVLVKTQIRKEYVQEIRRVKGVRNLPPEVQENYGHLEFTFSTNVLDSHAFPKKSCDFAHFVESLKTRSHTYHQQEMNNVLRRIEKLQQLLPVHARRMVGETDPFTLFYSTIIDSAAEEDECQMPSDTMLEKAIQVLEQEQRSMEYIPEVELPTVTSQVEFEGVSGDLEGWILENNIAVRGECSICNDPDSLIMVRCQHSTSENPHQVCAQCVQAMERTNGFDSTRMVLRCPICRSSLLETIFDTNIRSGMVRIKIRQVRSERDGMSLVVTERHMDTDRPVWLSARGRRIPVADRIGDEPPPVDHSQEDRHNLAHPQVIKKVFIAYLKSWWNYMKQLPWAIRDSITMRVEEVLKYSQLMWLMAIVQKIVTGEYKKAGFLVFGPVFAASAAGIVINSYCREGTLDEYLNMRSPTEIVNVARLDRSRRYLENYAEDEWFDTVEAQMDVVNRLITIDAHECPHNFVNPNRSQYRNGMFYEDRVEDGEVIRVECPNSVCAQNCAWDNERRLLWIQRWSEDLVNKAFVQETLERSPFFEMKEKIPIDLIPAELWQDETRIIPWQQDLRQRLRNTTFADILSYFGEKVQVMLKWVEQWKYVILGIVALIGVPVLYKYINGRVGQVVSQFGDGSTGPDYVDRAHRINKITISGNAGGHINNQIMECVSSAITRNFVVIQQKTPGGRVIRTCNGIGLYDNKMLILKHYIKVMRAEEDTSLVMVVPGTAQLLVPLPWEYLDRYVSTGVEDVIVIDVPSTVPRFKNIVKYIPRTADLPNMVIHSDADLLEPPSRGSGSFIQRSVQVTRYLPYQTVDLREEDYVLEGVLEYNYSRKGACGSILLNQHDKYPIIGVHVAGVGNEYSGKGYSVVLTQEMFENVSGQIMDVEEREWENRPTSVYLSDTEGIIPLGACKKGEEVYIPNKTGIHRSDISPFLPDQPITDVVILNTKDPRYDPEMGSPYVNGIKKHGIIVDIFPRKSLNWVRNNLIEFMCQFRPMRIDVCPLTEHQSIGGVPDLPYVHPIPLATSAGWPYSRINSQSVGKHYWIDADTKTVKRELLRGRLDEMYDMIYQGIVPEVVFMDMMKDERKKIEKIKKSGSTRIICASPVDYTIALRRFVADFCSMVMARRIKNMVAIGINPDSEEWTYLYRHLDEVGRKAICLDYKDFGPAFSSEALEIAIDIVIEWYREYGYDERELLALRCILMPLLNSRHIAHDFVYQQLSGAPSGSALTAIFNSIVNLVYILICWNEIVQAPFSTFMEHVRLVVYGDDLIMTVSDQFIDIFNAQTIMGKLEEYSVKTQWITKDGMTPKYINLIDAEFLKRGFSPHPLRKGMFLAPLPEYVVIDCAHFVHKSLPHREATLVNAEMSLRLAYTRGEAWYRQWQRKLNRALGAINEKPLCIEWKEVDKLYFDNPEIGTKYVNTLDIPLFDRYIG